MVVTLVDDPNPPLNVYFDAGLLSPLHYYTDNSWVLTSTALASLPPQNWVIEQRQRQQHQQRQQWLVLKQQELDKQQQQLKQRLRHQEQQRLQQ